MDSEIPSTPTDFYLKASDEYMQSDEYEQIEKELLEERRKKGGLVQDRIIDPLLTIRVDDKSKNFRDLEFANVEDDNDMRMIRMNKAQEGVVANAELSADFTQDPLFSEEIKEFVSSIEYQKAMDGLIERFVVRFKDVQLETNEERLEIKYLTKHLREIAAAIAYITATSIQNKLSVLPPEESNKYFKIVISMKSVFRKLDGYTENGIPIYRFNTFAHEEELSRYQNNGVQWGITTPLMCYKIAYTITQRILWKTKTPSSDWVFHKIHSVAIQTFQVDGPNIRGGGKRSSEEIISDPLYREDGLLKKISNIHATISPNVDRGCFLAAIKIAIIFAVSPDDYKIEHIERADTFGRIFDELVAKFKVKKIVLPEIYNWDYVPLEERVFDAFVEANPHIFLHVWIQVASARLPLQLFYRSNPDGSSIPIHILFVGPSIDMEKEIQRQEEMNEELQKAPKKKRLNKKEKRLEIVKAKGHYHAIKRIGAFFYHTTKCNGKTKTYCPWCMCYNVTKHCRIHAFLEHDKADKFYCGRCMNFFTKKEDFDYHRGKCLVTDKNFRTITLPNMSSVLTFPKKHRGHLYKLPVVMIADFESILRIMDERDELDKTKTWKVSHHIPCSFGVKVITQGDIPELEYFTYTGKDEEDVMDAFCYYIIAVSEFYFGYFKENLFTDRELTEEERETETHCHICGIVNDYYKKCLRGDIDYYSGKYLGAVCEECLRIKKNQELFIPLVFHNARGYDLHHIIKHITKSKFKCTHNGIPQNAQKLMSMTISRSEIDENEKKVKTMYDIRIIDSLLFLLKSLEKLTDILKEKHPGDYKRAFPRTYKSFMCPLDDGMGIHLDYLKSKNENYNFEGNGYERFLFTENQVELVLQKNLYPYKWFDSFEKFDHGFNEIVDLVDRNEYSAFTDNPNDKEFQKSFEKKKEIFYKVKDKIPDLNTAKDYANIYLACDVLQLTDIIENTRDLFMKTHKLDPMYYFGAPGYSWDAFLYMLTMDSIEWCPALFKQGEINKVCFFMQAIRGGCSGIMKRYAIANNPMLKDVDGKSLYDPTKECTFIIYLDANNLYGWSMRQALPYKDFNWYTKDELAILNRLSEEEMIDYIERYEAEEGSAFFIEVDLLYPRELHDKHNLYPLAPEKSRVSKDDVSDFTASINELIDAKVDEKSTLLLQTLRDKKHYFCHSKTLKLYLQLGMLITNIHNGIYFKQAPLMRDYIDKNTELRNAGESVFEKELYKLLNNSIYGKTFENPLKYSNLKFINGVLQYNKVVASTGFKGAVFCQNEFMIAKVLHETIEYKKPLYLGATVTEFAKFLMFNFYYNVLMDYYKDYRRVSLLFTDTDSLMLEIKTDDIFRDIKNMNEEEKYGQPFDTSSFSRDIIEKYHIQHDKSDKVIGKFKSETGSNLIYRFIGLRSKMYAFQTIDEYNKGVQQMRETDESIQVGECHKKGKGIPATALRGLSWNEYARCLFGTDNEDEIKEIVEGRKKPSFTGENDARQEIQANGIRSFNNEIYSTNIKKFGLSNNDTKRFIMEDNIHTLAYGHYKISEIN